jgi:hypothetical protein
MSDNNINNEALGWDQDINEDGNDQEYVIVTEGNYYFEVTNFERGQYNGNSEKVKIKAQLNFVREFNKDVQAFLLAWKEIIMRERVEHDFNRH